MSRGNVDSDRLRAYTRSIFDHLSGALTSTLIHLGDALGLYRALAKTGPTTSAGLAAETGLHERWIREWLQQQAAAHVLEYEDGRFSLSPEAEIVLVREDHPAYGAGAFDHLPQQLAVATELRESFKSGIGLPYDAFGPEGARGVERGFAPWFRALLVPMALPRVPGLVSKLEAGARVADVGCGGGVALIEMARAFPSSEFHGYDISAHALERAERNREQAGVSNVSFHDPRESPLPGDASLDFVTTFDCLHDMTRPDEVMRHIRAALDPQGIWLICDIKARPSYEENLERNPMAALMYGFSVMSCMSSSLSEPGGMGLGTLGLHAELAEKLAREAGFSRFEPLDLDHPINAFYVVRP